MLKRLVLWCAVLALLLSLAAPSALAAGAQGSLRVRFFKIGKADAFLLRTDRHAVLIDTGETDDGGEIVEFLDRNGIETLDYLILTHYDKRSIGGTVEVMDAIAVKQALVADYDKDSVLAGAVVEALKKTQVERVQQQRSFQLDDVHFHVYPALAARYALEDDNDYSLAVSVVHGDNTLFFAGDITAERVEELRANGLLTPHKLLKVPQHGQNADGLDALLDALKPQVAVIPASEKNPPAGAVLASLDARGIRWYCTKDGAVSLTSDGVNITLRQRVKP